MHVAVSPLARWRSACCWCAGGVPVDEPCGAGSATVLTPQPAIGDAVGATGEYPAAGASVPEASEKTREQKRFDRYDKDRDGAITRDEYLASRNKAFAKLDNNHDGMLSFDEWAVKAETKFATADADKSGAMNAGRIRHHRGPAQAARQGAIAPHKPAAPAKIATRNARPPSSRPARRARGRYTSSCGRPSWSCPGSAGTGRN